LVTIFDVVVLYGVEIIQCFLDDSDVFNETFEPNRQFNAYVKPVSRIWKVLSADGILVAYVGDFPLVTNYICGFRTNVQLGIPYGRHSQLDCSGKYPRISGILW